MKKTSKYLLLLFMFGLLGFSVNDNSYSRKVMKIETYIYTPFNTSKNERIFCYGRNGLDSVVQFRSDSKQYYHISDSVRKPYVEKTVYKYLYEKNSVLIFKNYRYESFFSKAGFTKTYEYKFDIKGKLLRYIVYGKDKILLDEKYEYDEEKNTIRVRSTERYIMNKDVNKSETVYFLNSMHNIDSTYCYFKVKNRMSLYDIQVYKYDKYNNPNKNLLWGSISEEYFNTNNIVSCLYLDSRHKVKNSGRHNPDIYNYKYNSEGYLQMQIDRDVFESDSIVSIYHY